MGWSLSQVIHPPQSSNVFLAITQTGRLGFKETCSGYRGNSPARFLHFHLVLVERCSFETIASNPFIPTESVLLPLEQEKIDVFIATIASKRWISPIFTCQLREFHHITVHRSRWLSIFHLFSWPAQFYIFFFFYYYYSWHFKRFAIILF